ncbi:unnamed protein product [Bursaphelenchus okinawaensis]|uniref:Ubiquitin carboxyl-terminal hydrolase 47 n=1 Tax=Bursaphelenchus okinawaensis TaxID=465554 RepID=A0A811K9H4_9BILA|nr:unnamed protein product [Bursaphelenchus okinawaensis]CAG9097732.1 unnamed protein product [Bursaphelenchus okinawaensis]
MRTEENTKLPSVSEETQMEDDAVGPLFAEDEPLDQNMHGPPPLLALPAPPSYSQATEPEFSNSVAYDNQNEDENGHRYVGLVNQAMTCYLNSLIQTLYMTPEFRNIIYRVERKPSPRDIAFQLQKLFLQLQTSEKLTLETVDLTQSFGWENEVYDQHDVQELLGLMIDALEKRWANSPLKGSIETLFKGEVIDYVKCMNCKTVKSRNDIFLDLPLAVREDGAVESHKNLQEAMKGFIKPELLNGNNQYKCEKCDSLQDAQKGLGITKFPYMLVVQLKRFSFDYNTMHRIKLNDRVTFPDYLDLNDYLYKPPEEKPKMSWASVAKKRPSPVPTEPEIKPEGDWFNILPDSEDVEKMLEKGPNVYELFSVMVHQGSATGGHYYAYIKNLDQHKWMCFNDSNVNFASHQEVQRTFGGSFSYGGMNNSNAYLLMYRRIEKRNEHFISTPDLPPHIKNIKEQMEREEREKEERRALEKSMVKVNVLCNDFHYIHTEPKDVMIHKETSFEDIKKKLLDLYPDLTRDSRLVECKPDFAMIKELDKEIEGKPPLYHLKPASRWGSCPAECYIMVDSLERAHFYEIPPNSQTADVWLIDLEQRAVYPVKRVAFDPEATIEEIRGHLCAIERIGQADPVNLRIIYSQNHDDTNIKLLDQANTPFNKLTRQYRTNPQLYVDVGPTQSLKNDRARPFAKSEMLKIMENHLYQIPLLLHLPSLNDYCRLGVFPPIMCRNGARSPIASPFAIQRGDGKPFSVSDLNEDTNSSSTPCPSVINEAADNDVFTNWDATVPTDTRDTPNVSFLEGSTLKSEVQGSSSSTPLSASSTYSSAPSNNDDKRNSLEMADEAVCSKSLELKDTVIPEDTEFLLGDSETQSQSASVPPSYDSWDHQPPEVSITDAYAYDYGLPSYEEAVGIPLTAENLKQYNLEESDDDASLKGQCNARGSDASWSDEIISSPPSYQQIDDLPTDIPTSSGEGGFVKNGNSEVERMIEVKSKRFDANGATLLQLNVDKRMPVCQLQDWVSHQIKLPSNQVEFWKYTAEDACGYVIRPNQSDLVRDVMRDLHRVEVRPRLMPRQGEIVLNIHQYITGEPNIDKRQVLFDVTYDKTSPVEHLLMKCQALLKEVYSEEYTLRQLKLRVLADDCAPVLPNSYPVSLDKKLFLQVLDDKKILTQLEEASPEELECTIVIMVQRWCPETFETLPMFEVYIPLEEPQLFVKNLRYKIAERTGIPVERVEFSKIFPAKDDHCARYPFSKPISELIETVEFGEDLDLENINGKLVYVRDSQEERKVPTEDEKRVIRNKDQRRLQKETANTFRRMERPLRIQVASISESEP